MKQLFIVGIFCFSFLSNSLAQNINLDKKEIDSLKKRLSYVPDTEKMPLLQDIIINLWLNHPDTAMVYAKKAMALAERLQDTRSRAIANRMYGAVHYYVGRYDTAAKYGYRAYQLSKSINDINLMAASLNNMGLASYYLGSYSAALENLLHALHYVQQTKQEYGTALTLNNIGLVYAKLKNYTKAREYFNRSVEFAERRKDKNVILYAYNNIASTYFDENDFPKAQNYYEQALEISKSIDNVSWRADSYLGLAEVQSSLGKPKEASALLRKALALKTQIDERDGISDCYHNLAKAKAKENQLDSAFMYVKLSLIMARQSGSTEERLKNYGLLKDLYTQKKKYDSALFFQSKYLALRDSLFNETMARTLGDIQLKIQEEESQQQLADKDTEIQRKTTQTYLLIGGIFLMVTFLLIVFRFYKIQKRLTIDLERKNIETLNQKEEINTQKEALSLSNQELEKAQLQINEQNYQLSKLNEQLLSTVDIRTKELEEANKEIKVVSLELDNFIYKSSHDIKAPLARLIGICHLALLDVKDEQSRAYFRLLDQTAHLLNDIFNKLKTVSEINSRTVERVPVDFNTILKNVQRHLKSMEGFDSIKISTEVSASAEYYSDPGLLEIIFHNMLENSIRFQKKSNTENKFIQIKVAGKAASVVLSFIDNGIGIKQADVDHIFKMFSQAALEHQTVGLGLYIVKQCVTKLNGNINLVRSNQRNTEFEIVLA